MTFQNFDSSLAITSLSLLVLILLLPINFIEEILDFSPRSILITKSNLSLSIS